MEVSKKHIITYHEIHRQLIGEFEAFIIDHKDVFDRKKNVLLLLNHIELRNLLLYLHGSDEIGVFRFPEKAIKDYLEMVK